MGQFANFLEDGLVSVLVPSYNHLRYIRQCIESIKNQTYKKIQLIVIDDGSIDGSKDFLVNLSQEYAFELHLQENIGLPATLNKALANYVRGEFFSICASDDYFHPEKISKLVSYLNSNKSVPMCFSKTIFVDENDIVQNSVTASANRKFVGGRIFDKIITQEFHFLPGMVRTSLYDEFGLYDKDIWTEDFYFNLMVSRKYEIGFVNEYLNYYRFPTGFSLKLTTLKVPMAHRACIDMYSDSEYYGQAIREWNFRNFLWFSGDPCRKKFAFKSMLSSISCFYRISFIKSFLRLLFKWR